MSVEQDPSSRISVSEQDASRGVSVGQPREQLTVQEPTQGSEAVDETIYPSGFRLWMAVASCCIVSFLHGLDLTIVAAAIPSLTNHFKTVADIGWYSSAYSLMTASFSFLIGKLFVSNTMRKKYLRRSMMSLKKLYIISICIFEAGSLLCTAAVTSWMFILGRAVAGVGSVGIVTGSYMIVTQSFPSRTRPFWTAVVGSSQFVGIVSAPLLGGVLIDWVGWRGCFGINIPLGVIAFLTVTFGFHDMGIIVDTELSWAHKLKRFGWVGTVCMMPSICCLLLALQWGGQLYSWKDARIIVLFFLFSLLLGIFAWRQHRLQDNATLPPRIFRMRSVLAATWFSSCSNATLAITEYYISIYFQGIKGFSATHSGLLVVPMLVGIIAGNLCAGAGRAWTGYYNPFMIATTVLAPVAPGLLTTINLDESVVKVACLLGFLGVAVGLGIQTPILALQTILNAKDLPIGIATNTFGATMGNAVWIVVSATLFQNRLVSEIAAHSPSVNATMLSHAGLSEISETVGSERLRDVLLGYDEAVTQTLYLPAGLAVATIFGSALMEWRSMKKKED